MSLSLNDTFITRLGKVGNSYGWEVLDQSSGLVLHAASLQRGAKEYVRLLLDDLRKRGVGKLRYQIESIQREGTSDEWIVFDHINAKRVQKPVSTREQAEQLRDDMEKQWTAWLVECNAVTESGLLTGKGWADGQVPTAPKAQQPAAWGTW